MVLLFSISLFLFYICFVSHCFLILISFHHFQQEYKASMLPYFIVSIVLSRFIPFGCVLFKCRTIFSFVYSIHLQHNFSNSLFPYSWKMFVDHLRAILLHHSIGCSWRCFFLSFFASFFLLFFDFHYQYAINVPFSLFYFPHAILQQKYMNFLQPIARENLEYSISVLHKSHFDMTAANFWAWKLLTVWLWSIYVKYELCKVHIENSISFNLKNKNNSKCSFLIVIVVIVKCNKIQWFGI